LPKPTFFNLDKVVNIHLKRYTHYLFEVHGTNSHSPNPGQTEHGSGEATEQNKGHPRKNIRENNQKKWQWDEMPDGIASKTDVLGFKVEEKKLKSLKIETTECGAIPAIHFLQNGRLLPPNPAQNDDM